jgi:hypothetical protein
MTHWGWYWKIKKKHISRTLCSSLVSIDSFKLYRGNIMTGFQVQPVDINAKPTLEGLKITYGKRKTVSYTIDIEKLPCMRMRFLYFAQKSIFLCRRCLNLSYQSQRLRPTERYNHMSRKVRDLITQKDGSLETHQKPPHMHQETHRRLINKQQYYEAKSHQALNQELRLWYGDRAEPFLDEFFDYVDESKPWKNKKIVKTSLS